MKSREFLFARECDIGYITPRARLAADSFTKVIRNDEVKSRSSFHFHVSRLVAQVNPVEHLDQIKYPNFDSRFFPQFPGDSFLQTLSEFQRAAGNGPFAEQRLAAAADQQRAAPIDNNPPSATPWPSGGCPGKSNSQGPLPRDPMAFNTAVPC